MPIQRRKIRNTGVLLLGILVLWWTLSTRFWRLFTASDFRDLQYRMNHGSARQPPTLQKSSFDWGQVPLHFPLAGPLTPLPAGRPKRFPRIQVRPEAVDAEEEALREVRRREVRDIFVADWDAYRKYAWLKDALRPISGGHRDQFCGWAATLVDSLDTLWIMGLRDEFDEAVDAVAKIDFGQSFSSRINVFETNIRYLGGLLAAYDLSKREALLVKAVELGDLLYTAFDTEKRMPVDFILYDKARKSEGLDVESSVVSASPGTLSLELTRLSQITGDPKYYDAISRVMDIFYEGQQKTLIPGLWPTFVSMRTQDVVSGSKFTLAGNADSLYEYLPKMHALLGGLEPKYEEMSKSFLEAAKKLLFRPMIPGNEPILLPSSGQVTDDGRIVLDNEAEHLGCYLGGVYAVAGRMLDHEGYVNVGSRLALGCVYSYRSFPTGIMPERFNMVACPSFADCKWNRKKYLEDLGKRGDWKKQLPLGFTAAKDPRYLLRPEAIESVFIMYRVTGDPTWQEIGWDMFTAIVNGSRTGLGAHASIQDVTHRAPTLPLEDFTESFWFAETLKYFYLLFSPPSIISLDDYVLNTEAHPFLRPK